MCVFFSFLVLLLHSHSDNFIDCKHICWSLVGYSFAGKLCAHICSIIRAAVIFGAQNANTHTRIGRMKNKHILYGSIHSRSKRGDDQKQASKQESNWWIQCDSGDKKLPNIKHWRKCLVAPNEWFCNLNYMWCVIVCTTAIGQWIRMALCI